MKVAHGNKGKGRKEGYCGSKFYDLKFACIGMPYEGIPDRIGLKCNFWLFNWIGLQIVMQCFNLLSGDCNEPSKLPPLESTGYQY